MLEHVWRIVVFLYALGEAVHLADSQDAARAWWWWAPIDVFFASLFAGCAVWNVCLAIRTLFSPHRRPSNINDAELNDGPSEENVA